MSLSLGLDLKQDLRNFRWIGRKAAVRSETRGKRGEKRRRRKHERRGEVVQGWAAEGSEPIVAQPGLRQDKYPPRACAVDLVARNQQSR